ncbi:MAG TPA: hypothetical protein VGI45_09805 [Terracidiphilus sp.]
MLKKVPDESIAGMYGIDKFLGWLVIVAPFVLSAIFIVIPTKAENPRLHMRWKIALLIFGLGFSGIAWWQQDRTLTQAEKDRVSAIQETARETAKETTENVTKAMGAQYAPIILKLSEQGQKVDAIGNSDIVTGRKPIPVVVQNPVPPPSDHYQEHINPEIHISSISAPDRPELGAHAIEFILTTNKVMNGGRVTFVCPNKINKGTATIAGASIMMGGGGVEDDHTL